MKKLWELEAEYQVNFMGADKEYNRQKKQESRERIYADPERHAEYLDRCKEYNRTMRENIKADPERLEHHRAYQREYMRNHNHEYYYGTPEKAEARRAYQREYMREYLRDYRKRKREEAKRLKEEQEKGGDK